MMIKDLKTMPTYKLRHVSYFYEKLVFPFLLITLTVIGFLILVTVYPIIFFIIFWPVLIIVVLGYIIFAVYRGIQARIELRSR